MKYMIMIYSNPTSRALWETFSEADQVRGHEAHMKLRADLIASGELVIGEALSDVSHGKGVAVREGQPVVSDGPFAEAKEQMVGFYLVDCETPERAVEIAARIPDAVAATIEIRPTMNVTGSDH